MFNTQQKVSKKKGKTGYSQRIKCSALIGGLGMERTTGVVGMLGGLEPACAPVDDELAWPPGSIVWYLLCRDMAYITITYRLKCSAQNIAYFISYFYTDYSGGKMCFCVTYNLDLHYQMYFLHGTYKSPEFINFFYKICTITNISLFSFCYTFNTQKYMYRNVSQSIHVSL